MNRILLLFALGIFATPAMASSDYCNSSKLARDAIRAIALVSNRSVITDMVGGPLPTETTNQHDAQYDAYEIWANYRNFSYSDKYNVTVELKSCRILALTLMGEHLPVQDSD